MSAQSKRNIPCDRGAEQAFLGALLIKPEIVGSGIILVNSDDFYSPRHQHIFKAIRDLDSKRIDLDQVTLTNNLEERGLLAEAGGLEYLNELFDSVPTAANIEHYARIIRDKSTQRKLIGIAGEIRDLAYEPDLGIDQMADQAESKLFGITERNITRTDEPMKEIVGRTFKIIQNFKNTGYSGLKTGFTDLDKLTSGLQSGQLIIIAGRPGSGKTAFCLNLAANASSISGKPIVIFSLEMQKEELCMRMLCSESKIENNKIKQGLLGRKDFDRLSHAAQKLYESKIVIDDKPDITITEARSKCRRIKNEYGELGLVIFDYMQLVAGPPDIDRGDRYAIISEVSRSLKYMAKELEVPVIALSQLSRKVEDRTDKRPQLSDLRESGQIEQDADIVAFIYRSHYYTQAEEEKHDADLIVQKHRSGATADIKLHFTGEYTRFDNATRRLEN